MSQGACSGWCMDTAREDCGVRNALISGLGMRCGFDASAHEDLGQWNTGEPMLVTESGQRFRNLSAAAAASS